MSSPPSHYQPSTTSISSNSQFLEYAGSSSSLSSSPTSPGPTASSSFYVQALYAYSGIDTSSLSFRQGDIIEVLTTLPTGWWDGVMVEQKVRGWFPSNYVQKISEEEAGWAREQMLGWWDGEEEEEGEEEQEDQEERLAQADSEDDIGRGYDGVQGRAERLGVGVGVAVGVGVGGAGGEDGRTSNGTGGGGPKSISMAQQNSQRLALEAMMRGEDLNSFSSGGDIFTEIAAAAASSSSFDDGRIGNDKDEELDYEEGGGGGGGMTGDVSMVVRTGHGAPNGLGDAVDEDQEAYWVPKVTKLGVLFYYNTRTAETSRYMPVDGHGDGVQIYPDEWATEQDDSSASRASGVVGTKTREEPDSDWRQVVDVDGVTTYFQNVRTDEKSWTRPQSRLKFPSSSSESRIQDPLPLLPKNGNGPPSNLDRLSYLRSKSLMGRDDASVFSSRTERGPQTGGTDGTTFTEVQMVSRGSRSDESADEELEDGTSVRSTRLRDSIASDKRRSGLSGVGAGGSQSISKNRRRTKGRRSVATTDLLEPPPPPLLSDLELAVMSSLQDLINAAQGGLLRRESPEEVDPNSERNHLAQLGNDVVDSIRTLLHSTGALDHVDAPHFPSNISTSPTASTSSSAASSNATPLTPPLAAHSELKPYAHRVTSNLSKLTLSIRGVWALLETVQGDQILDPEDEEIVDPEERDKNTELRRQLVATWAESREMRLDRETRLRSEVITGARNVQASVGTFLGVVERIFATSAALQGLSIPKAALRTLKAPQGSLRTNAGAMLLPGAGYGGNWRGNGFVTLPTPESRSNSSSGVLAYAYPTKPVSSIVASDLWNQSKLLIQETETLRNYLTPNQHSPPPPPSSDDSSPLYLITKVTNLSKLIAAFLINVEDIDVAASVDFELSTNDDQTRSVISMSRKSSEAESLMDPPAAEYRSSVQDAKSLLAELEISKQALYDISPEFVSTIQALFAAPSESPSTPSHGPQPLACLPLAYAIVSDPIETTPNGLLRAFARLSTAVQSVCSTIDALGKIADVQATVPGDYRRISMAFRSSLFDAHTSMSTNSIPESQSFNGSSVINFKNGYSSSDSIPPPQPDRLSKYEVGLGADRRRRSRISEQASVTNRSSVDSDYFFSSLPRSNSTTLASSLNPPAKQFKGYPQSPESWDEQRRSSIATSTTSELSDQFSVGRRDPALRVATDINGMDLGSPTRSSPSKSTSSKLAKLLGDDPTKGKMRVKMLPQEPTPSWLGPDYGLDEVSFNMEGQVKGGTLRALVIAATSHEGRVDSNYLSAFLMTYRTFCTSRQLLDHLIERFLIEAPTGLAPEQVTTWAAQKQRPIRARVANVIKSWVREHMDHDEYDPDLLKRIAAFAADTMQDAVQSPQIIKAVEDRLSRAAPRSVSNLAPGPLPPSIVPRSWKKLKFMEVDPTEIARQLTLMDGSRFAKITAQECLGKAWPKEYGSEAPNISRMIDMSNAVTRWVTETILVQEDIKKRANTIKHFIAVAEKCRELNNFSTLIHVIAGLNSTPIHRLRRTWETVSQKYMTTLAILNNVMRSDKNYKEYREILRSVTPPCVPFLGVYLTDWTFIGDGNSDMLREKPHQINFNKRQKASELILGIKLHQSTTYNLTRVPQLEAYLEQWLFSPMQTQAAEDDRLYEMSLAREPRERDDEKVRST